MGIIIAFWLNNWGVTPLGPAESTLPFDATGADASGGSSALAGFDKAGAGSAGGSSSLAGFDATGRL